MRKTLAIFFASLVLWSLIACANTALSVLHVYLFLGGLFVTYSALELPFSPGMAASLLAGLLCDANSGSKFGLLMFFFAAAHAVVFHLRERLPADQTAGRVAIALLANFGIFLGLSFSEIDGMPDPSSAWYRMGADLICSQVILALIAPWYFALQTRVLVLVRAEPERLA